MVPNSNLPGYKVASPYGEKSILILQMTVLNKFPQVTEQTPVAAEINSSFHLSLTEHFSHYFEIILLKERPRCPGLDRRYIMLRCLVSL